MVQHPPILKKETIKKIASDFCDLDDTELNDELLQMKRHKAHPTARARIMMEDPSSQANEEQQRQEDGEESQASGGEACSLFSLFYGYKRKTVSFWFSFGDSS